MLLQFIINGLIMGSIYSMVALGFALVYNTTRIFHISYAALYMAAPYFLLTFYTQYGFPVFLSVFLSVCATVFIGLLIELLVYRPLAGKKSASNIVMISSIGVMIIIINTIAMVYGNQTRIINPDISKTIRLGNVIVTHTQLMQFFISIFITSVFLVFLKFSKFGIRTRAMRDDDELCAVFGMRISRMRIMLFTLSTLFCAVGGSLVAWDVGMDPYVGMPMFLNAVVALIIGGIGRFEAPILGGYMIGVLQSLSVYAFSARWQAAVTFSLLILFLLFRPQGILGEKKRAV